MTYPLAGSSCGVIVVPKIFPALDQGGCPGNEIDVTEVCARMLPDARPGVPPLFLGSLLPLS